MFLAKGVSNVNQLFSLDIVPWTWENFPFEKVTSRRLAKVSADYSSYIRGDGSSVHAWTCFHKMFRFKLKWKAVQSYSNIDVNLLRYFEWERFLVGEDTVMQDLRMSAIQGWHEITEVCPSLKTNYQEFFPLSGTCWLSFH